jgi:hypothetical protein
LRAREFDETGMRALLSIVLTLALADGCLATSSVRLSPSEFRLIREVNFQGRDLFELAIQAGTYQRKGNEYLPGAERGAASAGGLTWHGSNGVGLVAYDPHMKRYYIYYLQDQAIPGHHLDIVYADDDFVFFTYGYHKDMPATRPALDVYSIRRRRFARVDSVSTRGGRFGFSAMDALRKRNPGAAPPSVGWDDRPYARKDWVPLSDGRLCRPEGITLQDGVFELAYHTSWGVDEFVTAIQFTRSDLDQEFERLASNQQ